MEQWFKEWIPILLDIYSRERRDAHFWSTVQPSNQDWVLNSAVKNKTEHIMFQPSPVRYNQMNHSSQTNKPSTQTHVTSLHQYSPLCGGYNQKYGPISFCCGGDRRRDRQREVVSSLNNRYLSILRTPPARLSGRAGLCCATWNGPEPGRAAGRSA